MAKQRGLFYGTSTATWQISDAEYRAKVRRHANILLPEDDLLWYQLKPTPDSPLDFKPGDKIVGFAERNNQLIIGAHLVWDEGFGDGLDRRRPLGAQPQGEAGAALRHGPQGGAHYKGRVTAGSSPTR